MLTLSCTLTKFLPLIFLLWIASPTFAQAESSERIAYFSFGRIGTRSYEQLAFHVKDNRRGEVIYSYGKDKSVPASYLMHDQCNGSPCFMIRLPSNLTLKIIPKGNAIKVVSDDGTYSKIFGWEYVGPVNGRGTWCDVCAEDEKEAVSILRKYFLR